MFPSALLTFSHALGAATVEAGQFVPSRAVPLPTIQTLSGPMSRAVPLPVPRLSVPISHRESFRLYSSVEPSVRFSVFTSFSWFRSCMFFWKTDAGGVSRHPLTKIRIRIGKKKRFFILSCRLLGVLSERYRVRT